MLRRVSRAGDPYYLFRIGGDMTFASLAHDWFGWPNGAVLTNLVASAICVGFGVWRVVKSHRSLHHKLDRLHSHLGVKPEHHDGA